MNQISPGLVKSTSDSISIVLKVNGKPRSLSVAPGETHLKVLREELDLTGTKEGCAIGECGACTVILDGRAVNSCLVLAAQVDGSEILTVEGLERDGALDALQEAFIRNHAVQCGYCTPGMLMSAKALLDEIPNPSEEDIRAAISGNLCRCTGYDNIVKAILDAAASPRGNR